MQGISTSNASTPRGGCVTPAGIAPAASTHRHSCFLIDKIIVLPGRTAIHRSCRALWCWLLCGLLEGRFGWCSGWGACCVQPWSPEGALLASLALSFYSPPISSTENNVNTQFSAQDFSIFSLFQLLRTGPISVTAGRSTGVLQLFEKNGNNA